ncbi:MAG TPA: SDR family oxidoreductase [Polyangiaceae bacterium]|nr:SDR family oxidoreductase [Polyangiaceae bacterium]
MTSSPSVSIPALTGWALVLGASSGFGETVASYLARAGCHIIGVHMDRRATMSNALRIQNEIKAFGREAWFFNINAADADKRREVCDEVLRRFQERGQGECLRVVLHSLAFGSLRPMVAEAADDELNQKQIEMTSDVMAHSLVYWVQDLMHRSLIGPDGRIFAMTSTGAWNVWKGYGAVSSAKAALEAHVRQLACELGPRGITANAICAGVTDTPALRKIPASDEMVQVALRKNPFHRLTRTEDVAAAIVALAQPSTYWINGNVINVDGGEAAAG